MQEDSLNSGEEYHLKLFHHIYVTNQIRYHDSRLSPFSSAERRRWCLLKFCFSAWVWV